MPSTTATRSPATWKRPKRRIARFAREAEEARREAARTREMLARSSLALTQLEAIERDAAALRERALGDARAALMASMSPSAIPAPLADAASPAPSDTPATALAPTQSAPPASGAAEKRKSKGPSKAPSKAPSKRPPSMPVPERPAPKSLRPDDYESVSDLEFVRERRSSPFRADADGFRVRAPLRPPDAAAYRGRESRVHPPCAKSAERSRDSGIDRRRRRVRRRRLILYRSCKP